MDIRFNELMVEVMRKGMGRWRRKLLEKYVSTLEEFKDELREVITRVLWVAYKDGTRRNGVKECKTGEEMYNFMVLGVDEELVGCLNHRFVKKLWDEREKDLEMSGIRELVEEGVEEFLESIGGVKFNKERFVKKMGEKVLGDVVKYLGVRGGNGVRIGAQDARDEDGKLIKYIYMDKSWAARQKAFRDELVEVIRDSIVAAYRKGMDKGKKNPQVVLNSVKRLYNVVEPELGKILDKKLSRSKLKEKWESVLIKKQDVINAMSRGMDEGLMAIKAYCNHGEFWKLIVRTVYKSVMEYKENEVEEIRWKFKQ